MSARQFSLLKNAMCRFSYPHFLLFGAPAIVGDITPSDGVPKEEKSRREKEALDHMCELLGGGSRGEYQNLQL